MRDSRDVRTGGAVPRRRFRQLSIAALLALAALVVAGAGLADARRAAPSGTLTIATAEPPQTFDPIQSANSTVDQMALNNYDALVQFAAGDASKPRPALARSWKMADGGKTYTFTLRNATFHDGAKVTAADVKFTLDRIKKLKTGIFSEVAAYASSTAVNPTTVRIRLASPYAPFLGALSRVYILNAKLVQPHLGSDMGQKWLANNDAGSGPYVLESYEPNQQATFTAYPKYWRGWAGSHSATVVYKFIAEASTQREALKSGDADIAMNIAKTDLAAFKQDAKYRVDAANTLVQYYVYFNTQNGPTKDVRVRQALSLAYDYKTHVDKILLGYGKEAKGPLPTPIPCHDAGVNQPTYDLDKAKSLLKAAGYDKLTLSMEYLPVLEEEKKSFQLYQSALSSIGVTLKPIATTFPAYCGMVKTIKGTPDLAAVYAFPPFPDASEVLYINYDSKFTLARGYNWGQYANPKVDALVEKALVVSNPAQRCALYKRAQDIIANDYVSLNISLPQYTTVLGANVKGYRYNAAHHQTENTYDISVAPS
jgi:peptide/nickel transport system substrate-binding protein